ncbi:MAG: LuxR C-terminal-related transcriptional regulator, partial [Symbiobacteriaceae bacterium]|nr:LuxR C-terminal-related transcriptional regulator [Symbiobacteriaceae bacterium]
TLPRFKRFAELVKTREHPSKKTYLVLDDFHLIHSPQALTFAERCAYLPIPGACVILISRTEPAINALSLFTKGRAAIITEDELRFTASEVTEFLRQNKINLSPRQLPLLMETTGGWALAVRLLSLVLKRDQRNLPLALETMKQNIFKIMETEAFNNLTPEMQKSLVQFSLISDLPLAPIQAITQDLELSSQANHAQYTSLMWYDSFVGHYRVHPLYLEYLQSREKILTPEEKLTTYRQAAQWCRENNFLTDAVSYYAKSYQYNQVLQLLLSYPRRLPPESCLYFISIIDNLEQPVPEEEEEAFLLLQNLFRPVLFLGSGKLDEALAAAQTTIQQWQRSHHPLAPNVLASAYSNLAYIDLHFCTVTHQYLFAEYLAKAVACANQATLPLVETKGAFAVADVRAFACLVGEGAGAQELQLFQEQVREAMPAVAATHHRMYYGYDDLVACEIAFFQNKLTEANNLAHSAITKSREFKQFSLVAMGEQYLLRIALHQGDAPQTKIILKQLQEHLNNPDFWNSQLLYDLYTGLFYAQLGLPKFVPAWLKIEEKESAAEVRIPIRELIVGVRYLLAQKKYNQALTMLINSYPRNPTQRYLLGELTLTLSAAVCRLQLGDTLGAMADFRKGYALSLNGNLETPFIELGRELVPLVNAALKDSSLGIPQLWLRELNRKATIYAKKVAVVAGTYGEDHSLAEGARLSDRELEVLSDLYHGLSREEIATNRFISLNTVKKTLQFIFLKLGVNRSVDAIRVALEKGLIS